MITYKEVEGFPVPTFHCEICLTDTEGFSICLKCNPQTYEVIEPKPYCIEPSVFEREIWNAAIEAAALIVGDKIKYPTEACAVIRGLKK